ncbi:hypothetical protein DU258_24995, partial [Salmonella enterica subsp. enterica]|nr:hypothetical protein [Salmonella enterica subsp. enterica serovar Kambole]EFT4465992.1 RHS repeat protein [Salmonella enterica subsp. enterica serovar Kambole]MKD05647.1 hypothetical protein [Salmonella enterica subsp. enterica serovar Kambole]
MRVTLIPSIQPKSSRVCCGVIIIQSRITRILTWNAQGLMSSHWRTTWSVESWQYTPEGQVTVLTNGNGAQYRFTHDADGRLVREVR